MSATPKAILSLTADAGFGHRAAANAVAAALGERHTDDCRALIVNPLEERHAARVLRLAQHDYDRMIRQSPELYRLGYETSDRAFPISIAEQALVAMLYANMRDLVEAHRPDAIVSTYPLFQSPLAALFALSGRWVPPLVVVTDLVSVHGLWFNSDVDLCLAPTRKVQEKALESGLPPDRIEITGLPVNPELAHTVERAALRTRLGWSSVRTVALIAGSKRVTRLEPVMELLDHCGWPPELALVAGGNKELEDRWSSLSWHQTSHVYGYVENMAELMLASDTIVCKAGGLVVSEALAAGLPLQLVQALPGQEVGNAAYVTGGAPACWRWTRSRCWSLLATGWGTAAPAWPGRQRKRGRWGVPRPLSWRNWPCRRPAIVYRRANNPSAARSRYCSRSCTAEIPATARSRTVSWAA